MIEAAKSILQQTFGYSAFRHPQAEIITNILQRHHTLVIMPTGSGKSLCYQIPALLFNGLTVVISPLIALMQDQVQQLEELGVAAIFLNSSLTYDAYQDNIQRLQRHEIKLLYLAPETLFLAKTLTLLKALPVDCVAIDEAHCISEWGHDFRPEYRQLLAIQQHFPKAVRVALTATATPRVQQDIKQILQFEDANQFISSFNRENLFLEVKTKTNPRAETMRFIQSFSQQSGIIYCSSRNQVDELTEQLKQANLSVAAYHAGLSDEQRKQTQNAFLQDDIHIIVATIAFGMGINKPNVRFILHYDLPKNLESYYQQIGRAGRDGLGAQCLLLFSYGDIRKIKYFIDQKESEQEKRIANLHLNALLGFAETDECRRIALLQYFGEAYSVENCGKCDNCIKEAKPQIDLTIAAQKFLSCVYRTNQRFGAGHIIDVLRGSRSQKILNFQHDKVSTYNIGKEYSRQQWLYLSRQFIQKGLLKQDMEYGTLALTDKAWQVFRNEVRIFGKLEDIPVSAGKSATSAQAKDQTLFEILRQKRKALADQQNLPPYTIFSDKTLLEIATYFPQKREHLLMIHGVGAAKLEKYGNIFLELIQNYCQAHQIIDETSKRNTKQSYTEGKTSGRSFALAKKFNDGQTIDTILQEEGITLSTLLYQLYQYLRDGHTLRTSHAFKECSTLSAQEQQEVATLFDQFGVERLKPLYLALNAQVEYDQLHLLRVQYLIDRQS